MLNSGVIDKNVDTNVILIKGSIKNVIGANKAIAIVTLRPGIAPITKPPPTPKNMASIGPKLITLEKAWPISSNINFFFPLSTKMNPRGGRGVIAQKDRIQIAPRRQH